VLSPHGLGTVCGDRLGGKLKKQIRSSLTAYGKWSEGNEMPKSRGEYISLKKQRRDGGGELPRARTGIFTFRAPGSEVKKLTVDAGVLGERVHSQKQQRQGLLNVQGIYKVERGEREGRTIIT